MMPPRRTLSHVSMSLAVATSGLVAAFVLTGCATTDSATRYDTRVSVNTEQNVTEYRTPTISLRQEIDLTRYPVSLVIRGACEGTETHCRPNEVVWEFDGSAEYWQYQVDPSLEIFLDGQPYVYRPDVNPGPLGPLSVVTQSRFVVPFSITERVATTADTRVRIGGNDVAIDSRRKGVIAQMTRTIQGRTSPE